MMIELIFTMCFLPFVQAPELPVYAEEGSTYQLKCLPSPLPTNGMVDIKYRWMTTDGQPLTNDRYFIGDDGQLEITGVAAQDSGDLMCQMVFGDINSGVAERDQFIYSLTVYTLPAMVVNVTINYRINSCEDDYDNNIWKEIFITALRMEVCRERLCNVRHFEMKCMEVQEEVRDLGDLSHEIQFIAKIHASHSSISPCNRTCTLRKLTDHVELIIGKLQRYTDIQSGQLASYPSLGFHVVKGSLQTQVTFACIGGHGLRGDICVSCEPGTYSPDESPDCNPCSKGSYEPNYAASKCETCPVGHRSYKPGARDVKQCHNREMTTFILGSIGIATLVTILCFVFVLYKIIKKKVIKSHGVKLPGLDFGEGVDLLENMHEADEDLDKKHKKKLRFESKLSLIKEEHTPLIADDLGSPRKSAILRSVSVPDVQEEPAAKASEALMVTIEEDTGLVESTSSVIEMEEGSLRSLSSISREERKRARKQESEDLAYANLDHKAKAKKYVSSEGSVSSTSSSSDSSSSTSTSSYDSESGESESDGESPRIPVEWKKSPALLPLAREESVILVADASEEHTPIFPTDKLPSAGVLPLAIQQSHSALMLNQSPSRDSTEVLMISEKQTSRTRSQASSRKSQSFQATLKSPIPSQWSLSPHARVGSRHGISSRSQSIAEINETGRKTSVHRSPSVSPSAHLAVRRTLSDVSPRGFVSPPQSSALLSLRRPSSITRLAPSPPVLSQVEMRQSSRHLSDSSSTRIKPNRSADALFAKDREQTIPEVSIPTANTGNTLTGPPNMPSPSSHVTQTGMNAPAASLNSIGPPPSPANLPPSSGPGMPATSSAVPPPSDAPPTSPAVPPPSSAPPGPPTSNAPPGPPPSNAPSGLPPNTVPPGPPPSTAPPGPPPSNAPSGLPPNTVPPGPPPSTAPPGPPPPSMGPPSAGAPGRAALLGDIQKRRRDDCVTDSVPAAASNNNSNPRPPLPSKPPKKPILTPVRSSSSQSPGRAALLKDFQIIQSDSLEEPVSPTRGTPMNNQQEWFSCMSDFETSPSSKESPSPAR